MIATTDIIQGPAPYTEEWFALRKFDPDRSTPVVFGASEAAAACNQSRYSSALQLYLEKLGEWERDDTPEALERMEIGRRMEPVILDLYDRRTGYTTERDIPFLQMALCPWVGGTPDGIADDGQRSVDAKATNFRMIDRTGQDETKFGEAGTDQVPIEYLMQAQQQMAVLGVNFCDFPVLADNALTIYTVERNDDLIAAIIAAEKELAERIINADPPEPNWEHGNTIRVLQQLHGYDAGSVVELPIEALEWWDCYQRFGATIKELEADREQYKAKLYHAIGPAELARLPGVDFELKRTIIKDSFYTDQDVREAKLKIGQVKRKGHVRLTQRKLKVKK